MTLEGSIHNVYQKIIKFRKTNSRKGVRKEESQITTSIMKAKLCLVLHILTGALAAIKDEIMLKSSNKIKELLSMNRIEEAISFFFNILNSDLESENTLKNKLYNQLVLISSRYHSLKTDSISNTELPHFLRIHYNKIVKTLLELVDEFDSVVNKDNDKSEIKLNQNQNNYLVELTINRKLSEFNLEDQQSLFKALNYLMEIEENIVLRKVIEGSVLIYILLNERMLLKLKEFFNDGLLQKYGVEKIVFFKNSEIHRKFDSAYDLKINNLVNKLNKLHFSVKIVLALLAFFIFSLFYSNMNDKIGNWLSWLILPAFILMIRNAIKFKKESEILKQEVIKGREIAIEQINEKYQFTDIEDFKSYNPDIERRMKMFLEYV